MLSEKGIGAERILNSVHDLGNIEGKRSENKNEPSTLLLSETRESRTAFSNVRSTKKVKMSNPLKSYWSNHKANFICLPSLDSVH